MYPSRRPPRSGPREYLGSFAAVTCPAHGSVFGLDDGKVMRGPAVTRVNAYETRIVDGTVEIRMQA
jgi:nitrite reductase/ring-hydroxylating ferredoxin subunit